MFCDRLSIMDVETLIRKVLRKSLRVGFCIVAWALSGGGYFWPIWVILLYSFEMLISAYRSGLWSEDTVKAPVEDLVKNISRKINKKYHIYTDNVEDITATKHQ